MARAKGAVEPARLAGEAPGALGGTRGGTEATPGRRVTDAVLLGITVGLHLALLLVIFPNTREDFVLHGNLRLFFHDSGWTLAGAVPYRDFLFEYPPGSLLFMLVPHVFGVGFLRYRTLFFVENAVLDVIVVAALYAIARGARQPPMRPLVLYTLAVAALSSFSGRETRWGRREWLRWLSWCSRRTGSGGVCAGVRTYVTRPCSSARQRSCSQPRS